MQQRRLLEARPVGIRSLDDERASTARTNAVRVWIVRRLDHTGQWGERLADLAAFFEIVASQQNDCGGIVVRVRRQCLSGSMAGDRNDERTGLDDVNAITKGCWLGFHLLKNLSV